MFKSNNFGISFINDVIQRSNNKHYNILETHTHATTYTTEN